MEIDLWIDGTWLDVAVDDVFRVNIMQSRADARHEEGHVTLIEGHLLSKVESQVTARFEIHNEVTLLPAMKATSIEDKDKIIS